MGGLQFDSQQCLCSVWDAGLGPFCLTNEQEISLVLLQSSPGQRLIERCPPDVMEGLPGVCFTSNSSDSAGFVEDLSRQSLSHLHRVQLAETVPVHGSVEAFSAPTQEHNTGTTSHTPIQGHCNSEPGMWMSIRDRMLMVQEGAKHP